MEEIAANVTVWRAQNTLARASVVWTRPLIV